MNTEAFQGGAFDSPQVACSWTDTLEYHSVLNDTTNKKVLPVQKVRL
jgi:hypothetical protein